MIILEKKKTCLEKMKSDPPHNKSGTETNEVSHLVFTRATQERTTPGNRRETC